MSAGWFSSAAPVARRVRAYFAPVNRNAQEPASFDPSQQGGFDLDAPPAPWISLGCIQAFTRISTGKSAVIRTGMPAAALEQVRESLDAEVSFQFLKWTKLTMALATGSQHMNLLTPPSSGTNGGPAAPAVAIQNGSTATSIVLAPADASDFAPGSIIAVDDDYTGQTGFVGSPVSGAFVRHSFNDVDYLRRITFNLALVSRVNAGTLTLAESLPGGTPSATQKAQAVCGFTDRLGGSFYQEWSGLFTIEGTQGERIFYYYPRLQTMSDAEETPFPLAPNGKGSLNRILLKAHFRALPVTDPIDGERVLCFRSFLPVPNALP